LPVEVARAATYCDLAERLELVPPDAGIRGIYMRGVVSELEQKGLLPKFREAFPEAQESVLQFYPVRDYLARLCYAGVLVASPERVYEGIRDVSRCYAVSFGKSLLGRTIIRALSRTPWQILNQGLAGKKHACNYGEWRLTRTSPTSADLVMNTEYCWIDSSMIGSFEGALMFCGVTPQIEACLTSSFDGVLRVRW